MARTTEQAAELPDAAGLEKIFSDLKQAAGREDRSVLEISSVVALGAVRTGVGLGNVHVFDYYRGALRTIAEEGLLAFLYRTSIPYLTRAGSHYDPRSNTYSERLLRRWADRRSPKGRRAPAQTEATEEESPPVTDAKVTSSCLIINPSAGSAAAFVSILTRAARERGIGVRVLEPGGT